MLWKKKGCFFTMIILSVCLAGIVFCFRSCLSQFDERIALPPVLYFENDSSRILVSLIKYSKATSYSNTRGMIHKTVNNYYYLQSNDAISGQKLNYTEITDDLHVFPAKILGSEGNHAWVYINELMAFDAFSLEKVADVKMIETKNPSLKGMLPKESQYYAFNADAMGIVFKANDGRQWILHSKTLDAKPYDQPADASIKTIAERLAKQLRDRLKDIQEPGLDFNQCKVNQDTFNHQWLALYSKEEIEMLDKQLSFTPQYGQDIRRQFYNATYDSTRFSRFELNKPLLQGSTSNAYYLNGGFLADKVTGKAIYLNNPAGYLLIYKNIIGEEGEIVISRISRQGYEAWQLNTRLKKWIDYKYVGNSLFIFGNNNSVVSSSDCTLLLIVDCISGKVIQYDYFNEAILLDASAIQFF